MIPSALSARRARPILSVSGSRGRWRAGWVQSYLRDPDGFLLALYHHLRDWALAWRPRWPAPTLVVAHRRRGGGAAVVGRAAATPRLLADARRCSPCPRAADRGPRGRGRVWSNLVGLLRPSWRRGLTGQPHVV